MLKEIQDCFRAERLYYTGHTKDEMEAEESGEIRDEEVSDQPHPEQWIDFTRRRK